jgi:hypothetical protein
VGDASNAPVELGASGGAAPPAVVEVSVTGPTTTLDLSAGRHFRLTMGANTTLDFANVPATGAVEVMLSCVQDAQGGHALTLPAGTLFTNSGTRIILSRTPGAEDWIDLIRFAGMTAWRAFLRGSSLAVASNGYRAYRVLVTQITQNSYVSIGEIAFYDAQGLPIATTVGAAFADSNYSDDVASRAFDGGLAYGTQNWTSGGGVLPHWCGWDFGAGQFREVALVSITNPDTANTNAYMEYPVAGEIQWSNDLTNWVTAATFSGRTTANAAVTTHPLA